MRLGKLFSDELTSAGLVGLPFTWGSDGKIEGYDNLTEEQKTTLDAVIAAHDANKQPRRLVRKSLIVERLQAAGKLAAAKTALDGNLYARERWYAPDQPAVYADDPEALALLKAIGADPEAILAPE